MMGQEQRERVYYAQNEQYTNPAAIDSRIDPEVIISKIDRFLSGTRISVEKDANGAYIQTYEQVVEPPMNETGRFFLMAKLSSLMNKATVQGNFEGTHYGDYMSRVHKSLANQVTVNRLEWGVKENYIRYLVDFIIQAIEPFFTRLKDDKERIHFDGTVRTVETNRTNEPSGLLGRWGHKNV